MLSSYNVIIVTPFVGVWIEIYWDGHCLITNFVTPFVGVWIEIILEISLFVPGWSLPSWECGLKYLETETGYKCC